MRSDKQVAQILPSTQLVTPLFPARRPVCKKLTQLSPPFHAIRQQVSQIFPAADAIRQNIAEIIAFTQPVREKVAEVSSFAQPVQNEVAQDPRGPVRGPPKARVAPRELPIRSERRSSIPWAAAGVPVVMHRAQSSKHKRSS